MATTEKWIRGNVSTLLPTGASSTSLANNTSRPAQAYSVGSGYIAAQVEFYAGGTFSAAPTASTGMSLWFLRQGDGATFEDGSSVTTPARVPDVVFPLRACDSAQRITRDCMLPPGTIKPLIRNDGSGVTLTSGWTLKILPQTRQSV